MSTAVGEKVHGNEDSHGHVYTSYLEKKGWMSWLFTVDHKRIGVMYLCSVLFFFLIGGLLALAMRTELVTAAPTLIKSGNLYNQLFTLHGAIMIFLFLIPSIPGSIGNFCLPLMLGAKDVAFPRLNLLSYHLYVLGAIFFIITLLTGGLDTGWTFYTPYSKTATTAVTSALLGAFILGFAGILTGVNFIVTIHKMRAPGLKWNKLPLFVWAQYATSLIQILATPVLAITLLLLVLERTLKIGFFDPALGGDPVLFQHFFWFYSHPAVYIMILPGFGIVSELIPIHSRKNIFGYGFIAVSSLSIAVIGFLVWGHHMFVSGQSSFASALFSFITFAVAIPTAIKVFSWTATLYGGSIRINTPMSYALSFMFLFTIGGLTGLFLGSLSTDVHLHDTYFVVAHFHYVMMGGTFIAFLGGIHHWWSKMTGKKYNETLGLIASALVFIGFNGTFFSQFMLGSKGMPRRYHSYNLVEKSLRDTFQTWHTLSTIGSYILAAGLFLILGYLLHSLFKGEKETHTNPWGGKSLEWETHTPPDEHNFHDVPVVTHGPYDFDEIDHSIAH